MHSRILYVLPYGQMSYWGKIFCPKYINDYIYFFIFPGIRVNKRIGPHNINLLCLIFGSLLGDGYAEKHGNGTRISFYQEASHKNYLLYLHKYMSNTGYCNPNLPKIKTRLNKFGKLRYIIRFKTYTFSSFN